MDDEGQDMMDGWNKPREPERITRILQLLQACWEKEPDTRFNQFVDNLQYIYIQRSKENERWLKPYYLKDGHQMTLVKLPDLFYLEDTEFEQFLMDYLQERNIQNGRL